VPLAGGARLGELRARAVEHFTARAESLLAEGQHVVELRPGGERAAQLGADFGRTEQRAHLHDVAHQPHQAQALGGLEGDRRCALDKLSRIEARKAKGAVAVDQSADLSRALEIQRPFRRVKPGKGREDMRSTSGAPRERRDEREYAIELE
jgi:hypothetical protein